jgi:D-amino-acid dehydrogenase
MKIIVLGAGVTGVTSAWYLAQAEHEVTVVDRQEQAGLETSFANGGQISVSHPEPWANPAAPGQILRWLGREDAPLKFRPTADVHQWLWGLQFLRECSPARSRHNGEAIARLALYSRSELQALRSATGMEYHALTQGILHLHFDRAGIDEAERKARWLRGFGMQVHVLDRTGCLEVEPALAECRDTLLGGLYAPDDESGDAYRFTDGLAALCAKQGVELRFGTAVEALETARGTMTGVRICAGGASEVLAADAYVLCLGSYSPLLARRIGEQLPIYPVKGYSATLDLREPERAPRVSVTDESHRMVFSRLGNRLRAAGTAELNGYDLSLNPARCQAILSRAQELFPGATADAEPRFWAGLRPATPSNLPVIGRSRVSRLYFNTGHGTLGWTLACGSAHALADIVCGREPAVPFPFHGLPAA